MESKVVDLTFTCVKHVIQKEGMKSDAVKGLRSRARDIPTMIFTQGLAYTLTFIASRSSSKVFEKALESKNCEELTSGIKELRLSGEKIGYAIYGGMLTYIMKDLGLVNTCMNLKDLVDLAIRDPTLEVRVWPIVEWLKRVVEAYVEAT